MLVLLIAAAVLGQAVQDTPSPVDPVTVQPLMKRPSPTITDAQITQQLNDLHRTQPDRVVCVKVRRSSTLIQRTECATLAAWYSREMARDTKFVVAKLLRDPSGSGPPRLGPPDELVSLVKDGMKAKAMKDARDRRP